MEISICKVYFASKPIRFSARRESCSQIELWWNEIFIESSKVMYQSKRPIFLRGLWKLLDDIRLLEVVRMFQVFFDLKRDPLCNKSVISCVRVELSKLVNVQ
ncbi:UNKNOWN [Stylonychia lemnae]|uniref:Uncharacterized protein n=1 Tax=Stylonychia lemnae TaxID=5949 RepID=A0A078A6M7_STYLE|nr:UNKNOWN [Stylonychia lemnae]|eukprot:CDW77859.1 UNKNOWN [Stylonychia lemnae]